MEKNNDSVIEKAFSGFAGRFEGKIRDTLRSVLNQAMQDALSLHDERHQSHKAGADEYAWAIVNYGRIVESETYTFSDGLDGRLQKAAASMSDVRWGGILMAGMLGWFNVDYEIDILNSVTPKAGMNFMTRIKQK